MRLRRFLPGLALLLWGSASFAQVNFPTQQGNINAPGAVEMCLNTVGISVPCSYLTPRPVEIVKQPLSTPLLFPSGSLPAIGVGTGTTGAVSATIPAAPGRLSYLCGLDISAIGGTATIGPITIATLSGGVTVTLQVASSAGGTTISRTFQPCLPAAAINSAITVATTADGTATAVDVNLYGFQF